MITPKETKMATWTFTQKMASYFKVKKDVLVKDVEPSLAATNLWHSPLLKDMVGFDSIVSCYQTNKLNLLTLMNYRKFTESEVQHAFLLGEGGLRLSEQRNYFMALYLKGSVWALWRSVGGYNGLGGIFVGEQAKGGKGFVIEPLKNLLAYHYPHIE